MDDPQADAMPGGYGAVHPCGCPAWRHGPGAVCERQQGDQVADTDGLAAQSVADMDVRFAAGGCRVPFYQAITPAELQPRPEHGGRPSLGLSLLGGPNASEARAWNLGQQAAAELRASIAELEAEVALVRLAYDTLSAAADHVVRLWEDGRVGPTSRLSAGWEDQPDVAAPVPRTFPARALRFGRV